MKEAHPDLEQGTVANYLTHLLIITMLYWSPGEKQILKIVSYLFETQAYLAYLQVSLKYDDWSALS